MKRIVSFCVFAICLIQIQAQISHTVSVDRSEISTYKYDEFDILKWNKQNANTHEIGMPELPTQSLSFLLPRDASFKDLEVSILSRKKIDGAYHLYPVQPPVMVGETSTLDSIEYNTEIYNSDIPYPINKVTVITDHSNMGYHIVQLEVVPFEYIPAKNELYTVDLAFTINYENGTREFIQPLKQSLKRYNDTKRYIEEIVVNSEDIDNYDDKQVQIVNNNSSNIKENSDSYNSISTYARINHIEEQIPDYIIITSSELKSEFQRLADWKTKKGVPTLIKCVEDIYNEYPGNDNVERIREYLKECHHRWGEGLYVLLGGDSNIIPSRTYLNQKNEECPTDAYYTEFSDLWDLNKDGVFLEEFSTNFSRKLFIGRAPVENTLEANTFINKVLLYEKANSDSCNYSYINNYLVADAFINKNEKNDTLFNGAQDNLNTYASNTKYEHLNFWMQFDHYNCDCSEHKPFSTAENNWQPGEELNRDAFISAINNGGNSDYGNFHIIYHMDHSHPYAMGTSSIDKGLSILNSDADSFTNGDYLPIVLSSGCSPAKFTHDCIAEHFINNQNGGAVAFIGNADSGNSTEYSQFDSLITNICKFKSLGEVYIKIQTNEPVSILHSSFIRLHLLGDPEMPVWSSIPKDLDVTVTPESLVAGENSVTIQINNLPAGEKAIVCLMKDVEAYSVFTIADSLPHSFSFTPMSEGEMSVTITARNYRPLEISIPVAASSFDSNLIIEDILDFASSAIPGKSYPLSIKLKNESYEDAINVYAKLSCNSNYIRILNDSVYYGNIESHKSKTGLREFLFHIDYDAPEKLRNEPGGIFFYLTAYKNNTEVVSVDSFGIDVLRPRYKIVETRTDIEPKTTDDFNLFIDIKNIGKCAGTPSFEVSALSSCIDSISAVSQYNEDCYKCYLRKNGDNQTIDEMDIKLKLFIDNIATDSTIVKLYDSKCSIDSINLRLENKDNSISLYWDSIPNAIGYNIYKKPINGNEPYLLNKLPLTSRYYSDEGLEIATDYRYWISALNSSMSESQLYGPIDTWTVYPTIGIFPIRISSNYDCQYVNAPTTVDFDYDGKKEIALMGYNKYTTKPSMTVVLQSNGTDIFDIDGNVTTFSGFAEVATRTIATPTIADIFGNGIPHLILVTRDDSPSAINHIYCYSSLDEDKDNKPDLVWQNELTTAHYRSAIITDVNFPDGKGEKEIIIKSSEKYSESSYCIKIFNCNGELTNTIGKDTIYGGINTPAVADLDNDGYKEIIATKGSQVYVWRYNGILKDNKTFFTEINGRDIASSPIVCDLDNDGMKDILVASKGEELSYIYAIKQNGTLIDGFDGQVASAHIPYSYERTSTGLCHSISVGDIDNDGNLEVVALGNDCVRVWNNNGECILNYIAVGLFPDDDYKGNITAPILADVNGDSSIEILFYIGNVIYAITNSGEIVNGFPLETTSDIHNGITVSDIDNDGFNEIVAADDDGNIYQWKTLGNSSAIEWGRMLFDTENTSEYINNYSDQWVITSDTTYNGGLFTNDIIVRSGIFTIPTNVTLTMRKPYRIYVMDGATLHINGGRIVNADIVIKNGGSIIISNDALIEIREQGGNLNLENGAILNYIKGTIQ